MFDIPPGDESRADYYRQKEKQEKEEEEARLATEQKREEVYNAVMEMIDQHPEWGKDSILSNLQQKFGQEAIDDFVAHAGNYPQFDNKPQNDRVTVTKQEYEDMDKAAKAYAAQEYEKHKGDSSYSPSYADFQRELEKTYDKEKVQDFMQQQAADPNSTYNTKPEGYTGETPY